MFYLVSISSNTLTISFPTGMGYLARALKIANIDFEVIDLTPIKPTSRKEHFLDIVKNIHNGVFGFGIIMGSSCMETNIEYARKVKEISKNNIVIFGGPLATAISSLLLEKTECDYVVLGEGEERLPQLLNKLSNHDYSTQIDGVVSRNSIQNVPKKGPLQIKKVRDLDNCSQPLYDAFNMEFYIDFYKEHNLSFTIMASRGCWGQCNFCFKFIGTGFHARSASMILDEIEYVYNRWGFTNYIFREENFLQNRGLIFDLIKMKNERNIDFGIRCTGRCDNLDNEIVNALREINVKSIGFGVESVNQATLDKINKNIKVSELENNIDLLRMNNIEPRGSFIIGFPDDTEEDYEEMYKFIKKHEIKGTINFLTPLPKTRLFDQVKELSKFRDDWEFIKKTDRALLYQELIVNLTSLPDEVLLYHKKRLTDVSYDFYEISQKYKSFTAK